MWGMVSKKLKTKEDFHIDEYNMSYTIPKGTEIEVFCIVKDKSRASGEAVAVRLVGENVHPDIRNTIKAICKSLIDWEDSNEEGNSDNNIG